MGLHPAVCRFLVFLICAIALTQSSKAQPYNWQPVKLEFSKGANSFFLPDTVQNRARIRTVLGITVGGYGIAYGGIAYAWYRDFPSTRFHFFNDNHEWAQVDKWGHFLGGFQGSRGMIGLFKWGGMEQRKTALYGSLIGALTMLPMELLDGFATKWGASWGDAAADLAGAGLAYTNEMLWAEQRIQVKVSYHPTAYARARPDLFGDKYTKYLKDYNGHTGWLTMRVHSFLPEGRLKSNYPRWLGIGIGYGAEGMLGGYDNGITPEIRAREFRQYYLSPDIDLSAIPTKSGVLRVVLDVLNCVHLPSPALEFNSKHGLRFHWMYM